MGIRENIIKLRKIFGVTQEELAQVAGVTRGAVSQWEGGFSEPRMGAIERMAACYGLKKMNIIEDGGMDLIDPITKKPRQSFPKLSGAMPVAPAEVSYVPLRGRVHAGPFSEAENLEGREQSIPVPDWIVGGDPDSYACVVEGDCMNRVYPEGCVVIVSPNRPPSNGSVAVAAIDGREAVMRRMYRTPRTLVLSPDSTNPEHEDIVITSDSGVTVEFGGKVVWFQSNGELE